MRKGTEINIHADVIPLAMSDDSVTLAGVEIIHEYQPVPGVLYCGYIVRGTEVIAALTQLLPTDIPRA